MSDPQFTFLEFNQRRAMRGAPAARVQVDADGGWLWMSASDIKKNVKEFGPDPELMKALAAVWGGKV